MQLLITTKLILLLSSIILISSQETTDLASIDQINFGKSLLDTIQIQIQSEEGVGDLLKVLDQMRDTMNEAKEAAETEHQYFQQDCAKDIYFYTKEVNESTVVVADTDWKMEQGKDDIKALSSLLEQNYFQLQIYQDQLSKLEQARQEEALQFRDSMNEYDITTTAIEESKRYFVQIRGELSMSFLQTKQQVFAQVSAHFLEAKKMVKGKSYQSLFNVLAGMSSRADSNNSEIATKILELCNRVLENLDESRSAEQQAEEKRINLFMQKKMIIEESITTKQKQIAPLENQKAAIEAQVAILEGVKEEAEMRLDENEKLFKARQGECGNEIEQYEEERNKKLEEISICEQVITMVNTKFAVVEHYLQERRY